MVTLVTGASGFVGSALCRKLRAEGVSVRGAVRQSATLLGLDTVDVGNMSGETDWAEALENVSQVVHLAARVHVMNDDSADPLAEFRRVNVEGTRRLAEQAVALGVRRFVYVSSIKVNGEATEPGCPFTAADTPAPTDPYGISKLEAEQTLREICARSGMEWVIIRPPLVYGPGVRANFGSLIRWVRRGVPLPLGAMTANRRSLVALDNLVDLIATCLCNPHAANQTFLVSDGEDLSVADLLERIGKAMNRPARLIRVPRVLLKWGASWLGRREVYQRLAGSLQVDIESTRQQLGWAPVVSVDQALRKTVEKGWE
ncbi:SDR family oxidoreductase [Nitrogeniibacter mangrovi]|uniref:SDR family oxidoreductase n=1 Tax=Nitrogeniibacter mangrovi TaxID=2016596 RepID=A0A6C1B0W3_9RHOO|nr:SDR family oxidoreductase [Nitrogeniibacter mangrovi]QID17003.1 SDR family oxidoreductase [Nitrogeniibacter mangrovi]